MSGDIINTLNLNITFDYRTDKKEVIQLLKSHEAYELIYDIADECRYFLKYGHKFKEIDEVLEHIQYMIYNSDILKEEE